MVLTHFPPGKILSMSASTARQDDRSPVRVSMSALDVDALVASFKADPEFMSRLGQATVLIVPVDLGAEHDGPVFPNTTRDVFRLLRNSLGTRANVDAAVRDEDYVEFEFRSEQIILSALFIAQNVVLPFVIGLLASCVFDSFKYRGSRKSDARVKSQFHFKGKDGTQISLTYEGPAETYERATVNSLRDLGVLSDDGEEHDGNEDDTS